MDTDHPEFQFTDRDISGVPLFTYWLHDAILWSASGQSSEEGLSWAMIDKTA